MFLLRIVVEAENNYIRKQIRRKSKYKALCFFGVDVCLVFTEKLSTVGCCQHLVG